MGPYKKPADSSDYRDFMEDVQVTYRILEKIRVESAGTDFEPKVGTAAMHARKARAIMEKIEGIWDKKKEEAEREARREAAREAELRAAAERAGAKAKEIRDRIREQKRSAKSS